MKVYRNMVLSPTRWYWLKSSRRIKTELQRRLYRNPPGGIDNSILLVGAARSGTTWLAEMIGKQIPCRLISEPFNPHKVPSFRQFGDFPYRRPGTEDGELTAYVEQILAGNIRDPWIDREVGQISAEYRLIKTIRAPLLLRWMQDGFPDLPMLYIIRHPCAVVLSRLEADWEADADIRSMLAQKELVDDHLGDVLELIAKTDLAAARHAIVWCIQQRVIVRQFEVDELPVIFYEQLCLNPQEELARAMRAVGKPYRQISGSRIGQPSRTVSRRSAVLTGEDRIARWRTRLSTREIDAILDIVAQFDLDYIYGKSDTPISPLF